MSAYKPFELTKLPPELTYVWLRLLSLVCISWSSSFLVCVVEPTTASWLPDPLNPWHGRLFSIWLRKFEKFCIVTIRVWSKARNSLRLLGFFFFFLLLCYFYSNILHVQHFTRAFETPLIRSWTFWLCSSRELFIRRML